MVEALMQQRYQLILLFTLLVWPGRGWTHQLDECLQATLVDIEPREVRLQINLTPGVAVADKVLGLIDQDHDGIVSTNEAMAYVNLMKRDLSVRLDGRALELKTAGTYFPEVSELRTGWGIMQIDYVVALDGLAAGPHTLSLENRHLPAVSVYLFNAAQPKSNLITITEQKRNEIQSMENIGFRYQPPPRSLVAAGIAVSLSAVLVAVGAGRLQTRQKRKGEMLKETGEQRG